MMTLKTFLPKALVLIELGSFIQACASILQFCGACFIALLKDLSHPSSEWQSRQQT
jgi:hypothetical protein